MTTSSPPRSQREGAFIFLFALATYQYAVMTAAFANIRLGPANLQVTLVTMMLCWCALLRRERVIELLGWQAMAVLAMGVVLIPLKALAGLLHLQGVQSLRLFFILPLIWSLYAAYIEDEDARRAVATIIIWNCVFIAAFGLIHFFFFPSVYLGYAGITDTPLALNISLIPGHSQEAAWFGNPSGYGAILVCGLFALYITGRRTLSYVVAFLVIALGAYVSLSRAAALFTTILFALYLGGWVSLKRPQGLVAIVGIIAVAAYVLLRVPFFLLAIRFAATRAGLMHQSGVGSFSSFADQSAAGRWPGYKVGFRVAFGDFSHIFLGSADNEDIIIGDVNFSDNSFIFLALGFGAPLAVLWLVTVLRRVAPIRMSIRLPQALVLFFIYATLFTTPSISWDMWLLYVIGLLFIADERRASAVTNPVALTSP
jgi:hypothetical protein